MYDTEDDLSSSYRAGLRSAGAGDDDHDDDDDG